jgi:hypothetical protein
LADNAIVSSDNAIVSPDNAIVLPDNAIVLPDNVIVSTSKNKSTPSFPLPYLKTSPHQTEISNRTG